MATDSIIATAQVIRGEEATKFTSDDPAKKPVTDPNLIQAMKSMVDEIVAMIDAKISTVLEAIDNQCIKFKALYSEFKKQRTESR